MKINRTKLLLGFAIATVVAILTAQNSLASYETPRFKKEKMDHVRDMTPEGIYAVCEDQLTSLQKSLGPTMAYTPWDDIDCIEMSFFDDLEQVQDTLATQRSFINCIKQKELRGQSDYGRVRFCMKRLNL